MGTGLGILEDVGAEESIPASMVDAEGTMKVGRTGDSMAFNPYTVDRFERGNAEFPDQTVVDSADYDALLDLFKSVVCFKCKRSEEIDAEGRCIRHNLMAYPTQEPFHKRF